MSFSSKASLLLIGSIFGSLTGGITAASIGRNNTLFFCGIPTTVCFIMMFRANNIWYVYFAMFLGGLSSPAAHTIVGELFVIWSSSHIPKLMNFRHLYIWNMSQEHKEQIGFSSRPVYVFWHTSWICLGIFYWLEKSMPFDVFCGFFISFLASYDLWDSLLAMLERKEGWCRVRSFGCSSIIHPWLVHEYFRKALTFFRGGKYEFLQEELDDIVNAQDQKGPSKIMIKPTLNMVELIMFLKPFSAAMTLILFRLSGFSVVSHYTATYLEKAGINFDPLLGSLIIGAIRWLASLSAIVVLNFIAKKTSFITFGLISVICMMSGRWSIGLINK